MRTLCIILLAVGLTLAQKSPENIRVQLNANLEAAAGFGSTLMFAHKRYTIPLEQGVHLTWVPGGIALRIERTNDAEQSIRFWIDRNGNGSFEDEQAQLVLPGSSEKVMLTRNPPGGKAADLPYLLRYARERKADLQVDETLTWSPAYRFEGKLQVGRCSAMLSILDINGDGRVDNDSDRGSNIGIDRNGDGKLWGDGELLVGSEMIEFCGESFFIEKIVPDGAEVTLKRPAPRHMAVGRSLPEFTLRTTEGKHIRSSDLKGKIHVLDFWASWCKPCVQNLPIAKQLASEFQQTVNFIGYNVDGADDKAIAESMIRDHDLPWPNVIRGQGAADPLWKIFGSKGGNRLSIPVYVLVDQEGIVRYTGNGGKKLSELRAFLAGH